MSPLEQARAAAMVLARRVSPDTLQRWLDAVTPLDELDPVAQAAAREVRTGLRDHVEGLRVTDHGGACGWAGPCLVGGQR